MNTTPLKKEDYEEPCCPLKKPQTADPIPVGRVIERLDEYLSHNDYAAAERHLTYWLAEAEACNDENGKLTVLNEQIGIYRKQGKKDECLQTIAQVLSLADCMCMEDTVTLGTCLINAATGYKAFDMAQQALLLYQRAQRLYEKLLKPGDARLGGLYNNMALTLTELADYAQAQTLYEKAIEIMAQNPDCEGEMAISYLNLADLVTAKLGLEAGEQQIEAYLAKAEQLLETPTLPKDGNYAFICEKCAPVFGYYGHFYTEEQLNNAARAIYERT